MLIDGRDPVLSLVLLFMLVAVLVGLAWVLYATSQRYLALLGLVVMAVAAVQLYRLTRPRLRLT